MTRFKLKEHSFKIRDMDVTVREMTQTERLDFQKANAEDIRKGPALLAAIGCTEPKMSPEEWQEESAAVVAEVVDNIMVLCGMKAKVGVEDDAAKKAASPQTS